MSCVTMQDAHCSTLEEDKKQHYEVTNEYYRKSALHRDGYYDAKKSGELKHETLQLKIWEIFASFLDKILCDNVGIVNIIDIGCGRGDFTTDLVERYPQFEEIIGLDVLRETIDIATENAKRFDKLSFIQANLLNIPFKDKNFDITICVNLLHHIHFDDLNKAIAELSRITDKYLILEIRNKKNVFNFWYKLMILLKFKYIHVYGNSVSEISALLKKHNFKFQMSKGIFSFKNACRRLVLVYKRNNVELTSD